MLSNYLQVLVQLITIVVVVVGFRHTNSQLSELRAEFRGCIEELRAEVRGAIKDLRAEVRGNAAGM